MKWANADRITSIEREELLGPRYRVLNLTNFKTKTILYIKLSDVNYLNNNNRHI